MRLQICTCARGGGGGEEEGEHAGKDAWEERCSGGGHDLEGTPSVSKERNRHVSARDGEAGETCHWVRQAPRALPAWTRQDQTRQHGGNLAHSASSQSSQGHLGAHHGHVQMAPSWGSSRPGLCPRDGVLSRQTRNSKQPHSFPQFHGRAGHKGAMGSVGGRAGLQEPGEVPGDGHVWWPEAQEATNLQGASLTTAPI